MQHVHTGESAMITASKPAFAPIFATYFTHSS